MTCDEMPEEGLLAYGISSELDPPMRRRIEASAAGCRTADRRLPSGPRAMASSSTMR